MCAGITTLQISTTPTIAQSSISVLPVPVQHVTEEYDPESVNNGA